MKRNKKWLYEKWLEDHRKNEEQEKISSKIGVAKEKVIVNKVSVWGKALEIMTDIFFKLLSAALILLVIGLLSLAVTVLINPELRKMVFESLNINWIKF